MLVNVGRVLHQTDQTIDIFVESPATSIVGTPK